MVAAEPRKSSSFSRRTSAPASFSGRRLWVRLRSVLEKATFGSAFIRSGTSGSLTPSPYTLVALLAPARLSVAHARARLFRRPDVESPSSSPERFKAHGSPPRWAPRPRARQSGAQRIQKKRHVAAAKFARALLAFRRERKPACRTGTRGRSQGRCTRGSFSAVAGLGIGAAITLRVLLIGSITGGVMNPARAFATQIVEWQWTDAWI